MIKRTIILSLFISFLCGSCRKKEFEEYYGRPDWLADPIYQQLQARRNFTHLLAAIDKAGYKDVLSKAGYWTFFAPNDEAFEHFFEEQHINGDNSLDSLTARKIVTYALAYNAYRKDQLSSNQTAAGADTNQAFKRKTAYYDWVYTENGRKVIASNRNGSYVTNDNNNKNIPYFITGFLSNNGLSAADYNFFYPDRPFTGFNVADAAVVNADIAAENGIIHEVDRVILPLQNLESYLAANPQYSEFKQLLDKLVRYESNADVTHRNMVLTGAADSVFVKLYDAALAFSPNNENYLLASTDAQRSGWSLFVPENNVLQPYVANILKHYKTFEAAPPEVLLSLLNAHMWQTAAWPSQLTQTPNSQQEVPTFSLSNITDKKVLSNGFFYGLNVVQDANVFRSVFGKPFLDPDYSLMTRALNLGLRYSIINPNLKYTMFMMSNAQLQAAGYGFSTERNSFTYQPPGGTIDYGTARERIVRILETSVLSTQKGELDDLSGEGIVEAWNGEYIRYKNNTVFASGNVDENKVLHVQRSEDAYNGRVYYVDGLLTFTGNTVGYHVEKLATDDPAHFGSFFQYLKNSALWTASTKTITSMTPGNFYTVLIPTNDAIVDAVKAGYLPGNAATGVPDFAPAGDAGKELVKQFINYHILNKQTVVPDGKKSGTYETLFRKVTGDLTFITVDNSVNNMVLKDEKNNMVTVNLSRSNNLSNRAVIHSIDHFLRYAQ